jgi:hypothetical protein
MHAIKKKERKGVQKMEKYISMNALPKIKKEIMSGQRDFAQMTIIALQRKGLSFASARNHVERIYDHVSKLMEKEGIL